MNENANHTSTPSPFYKRVATDDGVQRAAAGVVVALIVAGTKELLFSNK